jgi:oxaloacetate decarboxylase alpha subunit
MGENKPLGLTDLVLRDGHQSLLATRMRLEDMLPIASKLDAVGFWALETWGGATFDACIRYLGEDPWERLRQLKAAMPNTPQQMLLRGQNILGYRHYADDVVRAFVERAATCGMDVFRIFDALNDPRNLESAVRATLAVEKHAQGAMAYTVSPVHDLQYWLDLARRLEQMGCHSICIKDMAGLLRPYTAYELVRRLKETVSVPIAIHSHATTGMSTATLIKAAEAGVDLADSVISSLSMTYSHSATESIVAILEGTERDTGLDLCLLQEIAAYFRGVRKKYARFEGSLRGVDSRILVAQVPGGMLTNMENQLREQGAQDRLDQVLDEIPRVRKDLGYIPLVTPTSQIVGTQAVLNVLAGKRYQTVTEETQCLLRGEYGVTPAPVNEELRKAAVAEGGRPDIGCDQNRQTPELPRLSGELAVRAGEKGIRLQTGERALDDVLTFALFPQAGLRFLEHRGDPGAFESPPGVENPPAPAPPASAVTACESYRIVVDGKSYEVTVSPSGTPSQVAPAGPAASPTADRENRAKAEQVTAPLAGTVVRIRTTEGQTVAAGEVLLVLEAMKMEAEIRAPAAGTVRSIRVQEGESVQVGDPLLELG